MPDSYEVRSGDTLSEIGKAYGIDYNEISKVNRIKNPNKIYPGMILTIPTPQQELDAPAPSHPEPVPVPKVPVKEVGRTDPYPDAVDVEVVGAPAAPASSSKASAGSGPKQAEAWGPGYAKSYPAVRGEPGSSERLQSVFEQMKYGDFWADWLDQALPQAVQGTGAGGANALLRSAFKLREMASQFEFHKLPSSNDPMAKWLFKNMKYFDRTPDPNYKKPDAGSEIRMDEVGNRPLAMRADKGPGLQDFLTEMMRSYAPDIAGWDTNVMQKGLEKNMTDAVDRTRTTVVPKNSTTATKSKEKP